MKSGLVICLTGLPAAGKSTLARELGQFLEARGRTVTCLDGDEVRRWLTSDLGYSREHRAANLTRIARFAAEIARHGGIAVCAVIAPYAVDRAEMRRIVSDHGRFVEVHVATPLAICMQRDPKGLYGRAAAGELQGMTGVDAPYEIPASPDLRLDLSRLSAADAVAKIVSYLSAAGLAAKSA